MEPLVYLPKRSRDEVLSGHRSQSFTYEVLDRTGALLGEASGFRPGGSLRWTANQAVKGRGNAPYVDNGEDIDWLSCRIRISVEIEDLESNTTPVKLGLGVWVPSVPVWDYSNKGRRADITLMSRETVLATNPIRRTYALAAGTNIAAAVRSLIEGAGEPAGAVTDNGAVLTTDRVWPATATRLQIINDLAQLSGRYFSLWTDDVGQYNFTPYKVPSARNRPWDFVGAKAVYVPRVRREQDLWKVPNLVQVSSQSTGAAEPVVVEAINEDPESKLSTVWRGIVAGEPETVDSTDTAVLQAYAQRRLAEQTNATATNEVEHLILPVWFNDAVRFPSPVDGREVLQVVSSTSVSLKDTGRANTTLREVLIDA